MAQSRRDLLKATGIALASAGLAGCGGNVENTENRSSGGETNTAADEEGEGASAAVAVAAEWNAMRARLFDAVALGTASEFSAGVAVAADVFARFESSSGEWSAHERLEHANEKNYESFETNLGALKTELDAGNLDAARKAAVAADNNLLAAIRGQTSVETADALTLQLLGVRVANAGALAAAGHFEAASTVAHRASEAFESAEVHGALEEASHESYETFEAATETTSNFADQENAEKAQTQADAALSAAVTGSYAVAGTEAVAGTGHLATMQAQGFDAEYLTTLGGPSTEFAHAAALTVYRARIADAGWLYTQGKTDTAATSVQDVFAHFEGAKAHEGLEAANHDAYEGFEGGLESLTESIEADDAAGVEQAIATVDENLRAGIESLGSGVEPAVLQSAYFSARFSDAYERYLQGEASVAASIGQSLFESFEANHADFHESLEDASEDLYESFEEEHLSGLISAFENGDDEAAKTHYTGALDDLVTYQTTVGSTAHVAAAQSTRMDARGFDAAVLATLGANARAETVVQNTFGHFEEGAGGFHEALEDVNHDLYESFEGALGSVGSAATGDTDAYAAAKEFDAKAVKATYTVVQEAGGSLGDVPGTVAQGVFASFEEAQVHGLLEEADHDAYETFESTLEAYIGSLNEGKDADAKMEAFAGATLRAQFAVAGALDKAPKAKASETESSGESGEQSSELSGGPNVVEGVPEDADHVVEMEAVAFNPSELTVKAGDKVAFKHVAGEAHSVTADGETLPDGATYWASGGFESQDAAKTGWEEGSGAVQSGQSYVHTFETAGTFDYHCIPHEAAGMTGTIVVE